MTPDRILRTAIDPALELLPEWMTSDAARALLLAIGLQESKLRHRRQVGGPARGYWQFERGGGVLGVLHHHSSRHHTGDVLEALDYPRGASASEVYAAIEHNDVLAAACARLLLVTLPQALPAIGDEGGSWRYYLRAWRPGRPHPETWAEHHRTGWESVGRPAPPSPLGPRV